MAEYVPGREFALRMDAADALAIAIAGLAVHTYDRNIMKGY